MFPLPQDYGTPFARDAYSTQSVSQAGFWQNPAVLAKGNQPKTHLHKVNVHQSIMQPC